MFLPRNMIGPNPSHLQGLQIGSKEVLSLLYLKDLLECTGMSPASSQRTLISSCASWQVEQEPIPASPRRGWRWTFFKISSSFNTTNKKEKKKNSQPTTKNIYPLNTNRPTQTHSTKMAPQPKRVSKLPHSVQRLIGAIGDEGSISNHLFQKHFGVGKLGGINGKPLRTLPPLAPNKNRNLLCQPLLFEFILTDKDVQVR